MQVFIVGTPLETAQALDKSRLNKQIIECKQILDALNGAKAWNKHPAVLQYKGYEKWLISYLECLTAYQNVQRLEASIQSQYACDWYKPHWHTQDYYDQMKRRLYTKDKEHYKQWWSLGTSDCNWYYSQDEEKFIKYINGKRVE